MINKRFLKKALGRMSVFLILFSQSPIAWLSSNVANASVAVDTRAVWGQCSTDGTNVSPSGLPYTAGDTFGYVMQLTNGSETKSYIYYGGATKTDSFSCLSSTTINALKSALELVWISVTVNTTQNTSNNTCTYQLSAVINRWFPASLGAKTTCTAPGGLRNSTTKTCSLSSTVGATTSSTYTISNFDITTANLPVSLPNTYNVNFYELKWTTALWALYSLYLNGKTTNAWFEESNLSTITNTLNLIWINLLSVSAGTCDMTITPTAGLGYSTTSLTNQPVVVTITANKAMTAPSWWTPNIDNTIFTKTYSTNGDEDIELSDSLWNKVNLEVSISNIDTTAIMWSYILNPNTWTNGDVISTLSIIKWWNPFAGIMDSIWRTPIGDGTSFTKTFSTNTTETVNFHDLAGNLWSLEVQIANIDKIAPICGVTYSTTKYRFIDVVKATLSDCTEPVTVTNNDWKSDYIFIPLVSPDTFTFEYVDQAGNPRSTIANKNGTSAGSCDWTSITTMVNNVIAAMGSQAFVDMWNNIWAIWNLGADITSLMTQVQNGGTLDPEDLQEIQDNITKLSLPDLLATADALNLLANALEAINPCTDNELINIDTAATVASLRATATALIDLDTGIKWIQSAFDRLVQPWLKPSEYVWAVSQLADSVAKVMRSVKTLSSSWTTLSESIDDLSDGLGWVELLSGLSWLGNLAGALWSAGWLLSDIVDQIDDYIDPIQDVADFTAILSDLLADIEDEDLDWAIDNLDLLLKTDLFNTAQQLVIDIVSELQDTLANMEAIKNASANMPILNLDTENCETNLSTYQTALQNYVATLLPLYTSLMWNIEALESLTKLDLENSTITLNTIIANLNELNSHIAWLDAAEACANLWELQTKLNETQERLEQLQSDVEWFLDNLETDMDGLVWKIDVFLEMLPETIRDEARAYIQQLKDILEAELQKLYQDTTTFLEGNKLNPPILGWMSCSNQWITLEDSVTLPMTSEKPEEVRWYVAIVTGPGDSKQLYVLPGSTTADLIVDTTDIWLYNVNIRTIGKDDLIHTSPVYAFLSDLDLNEWWNTVISQIAQIVKDAKSDGENVWNKLPGGFKLFVVNLIANIDGVDKDEMLAKLEDIKDGVLSMSAIVALAQDQIDSIGSWSQVSDQWSLKVSDMIKTLEDLDLLAWKSDTPALIKALINTSANYPIYKTVKPEIHDVSVAGIAGEISIQFSWATNVEDRNVVYKLSPTSPLENGLYTDIFSAWITTWNYMACKDVSMDGCQQEICSEPAIWAVTAINPDSDDDGINDDEDNCIETYNLSQENTDGDSMWNACDADDDNDEVLDEWDNCPITQNSNQLNTDWDSFGDVCDETPYGESDRDDDGLPDLNDNCPSLHNPDQADADNDHIGDSCDNCAQVSNSNQMDDDRDGLGNSCDQYNCVPTNDGVEIPGDEIDQDCNGSDSMIFQCNDEVDNDGDGRTDSNDADCSSSTDNNESDTTAPIYTSATVVTYAVTGNSKIQVRFDEDLDGDALTIWDFEINCDDDADYQITSLSESYWTVSLILDKELQVNGNCTLTINPNRPESIKDLAGNEIYDTQTKTIIDGINPVISLIWNDVIDITVWSTYTDAGATAFDNFDGDISKAIETRNNVNVDVIGTYLVTYDVSDSAGNEWNQAYRTVNVVASQWWGGGWGAWRTLVKDVCPEWDFSASYYDNQCGTPNIVEKISSGEVENNLIGSGNEYEDAYKFAFENGITTMPTMEEANMNWYIIRSQMAKMISNFAINVLEKTPDTSKSCIFGDVSKQTEEMKWYIIKSCQLWLMGYQTDWTTQWINFNPNMYVNRAQFGTILSRLIYGEANNGGTPFYEKHLNALKAAGIMTMIDNPFMKELRGFVMIMLMRAAQ